MTTQIVIIGLRRFTVRPPHWWLWNQALDRAGSDSARMLEECLLTCLEGETAESLRSLQAQEGDRLLAAALQTVDEEREALELELTEGPEEWRVKGVGVDLRLHPWTFGERNEALRRSLRLAAGRVSLDLPTYEMQMIQSCVTTVDGERLKAAAVAEWSLPLGELVSKALERLNGMEEQQTAILEACLREGRDHPDLSLLYLCRHFGWRPELVERMDARLAERLLIALKAVGQSGMQAAPALQGEGVSRILVDDD